MLVQSSLSRYAVQALAIGVLGGGIGLGLNAAAKRPVRLSQPVFAASASGQTACSAPPGAEAPKPVARISQPDARNACQACSAAFVDARSENAFANGHIPGALHLPPAGENEEAAVLTKLRGQRTVVVYDDDVGCKLAEGVAERLRNSGLSDVRVLEGSWSQWEALGSPAESGTCEICEPHASHP
jgi:3-mercaptopyruvate sulfurtransferase SseA